MTSPEASATDASTASTDTTGAALSGHAGELAVAVAQAHGVETMFTLSGAHVFPMYDGAVHADPPMRLLDVRHEQTAVFAAEALGKLTRVPGLAVLTAGRLTHARGRVTPTALRAVRLPQAGGRPPLGNSDRVSDRASERWASRCAVSAFS